jgi:hypothetical protein
MKKPAASADKILGKFEATIEHLLDSCRAIFVGVLHDPFHLGERFIGILSTTTLKADFAPAFLRWLRKVLFWLICILGLVLFFRYALHHGLRTGFGEDRVQLRDHEHYSPAKTLWDWLQLFGAPAALAVIAYLFQQARKTADQSLAVEAQRHSILQAYFNGMSELLASQEWEREARAFRRYGMNDGRSAIQQLVRARTHARFFQRV